MDGSRVLSPCLKLGFLPAIGLKWSSGDSIKTDTAGLASALQLVIGN
jgi:hypothetical protein